MPFKKHKKSIKKTWYFYDIPLTKETFLFALYIISIIVASFIIYFKFYKEDPKTYDIVEYIALLYLCFCTWDHHIKKLDDKQNLYKKVAWIAERRSYCLHSSSLDLRDFDLTEYIEIEQRSQNIPQQYCIDFSNKTEKDYLNQILNKHKQNVIQSYFVGGLKETKDIYRLKSNEYYFFSLHYFIYDTLSGYKDNGMYENKEYISECQFKCQLTEYGRVYYKLELITRSYIESNEQIQKLFEYIDKARKNHIVETLENNEVVFLSYRP